MVYKKVIGLFLAFVMVGIAFFSYAAHESKKVHAATLQQMEWVHDGVGDPTEASSYTLNTGDALVDLCEQDDGICGIVAPEDTEDTSPEPKPLIDGDLETRIQNQDPSSNDVFLLPIAN